MKKVRNTPLIQHTVGKRGHARGGKLAAGCGPLIGLRYGPWAQTVSRELDIEGNIELEDHALTSIAKPWSCGYQHGWRGKDEKGDGLHFVFGRADCDGPILKIGYRWGISGGLNLDCHQIANMYLLDIGDKTIRELGPSISLRVHRERHLDGPLPNSAHDTL